MTHDKFQHLVNHQNDEDYNCDFIKPVFFGKDEDINNKNKLNASYHQRDYSVPVVHSLKREAPAIPELKLNFSGAQSFFQGGLLHQIFLLSLG